MEQKEKIRKDIKTILFQISPSEILERSLNIKKNILEHLRVIQAKTVFIYLSTPQEVQTIDLIQELLKSGKKVVTPKVAGKSHIIPIEITKTSKFALGAFKILEPIETKQYDGKIDVIIVPGVAFGKKGERLGHGGGFYDVWLHSHREVYSIGVCFDFQVLGEIPIESHDAFVDEVISG